MRSAKRAYLQSYADRISGLCAVDLALLLDDQLPRICKQLDASRERNVEYMTQMGIDIWGEIATFLFLDELSSLAYTTDFMSDLFRNFELLDCHVQFPQKPGGKRYSFLSNHVLSIQSLRIERFCTLTIPPNISHVPYVRTEELVASFNVDIGFHFKTEGSVGRLLVIESRSDERIHEDQEEKDNDSDSDIEESEDYRWLKIFMYLYHLMQALEKANIKRVDHLVIQFQKLQRFSEATFSEATLLLTGPIYCKNLEIRFHKAQDVSELVMDDRWDYLFNGPLESITIQGQDLFDWQDRVSV